MLQRRTGNYLNRDHIKHTILHNGFRGKIATHNGFILDTPPDKTLLKQRNIYFSTGNTLLLSIHSICFSKRNTKESHHGKKCPWGITPEYASYLGLSQTTLKQTFLEAPRAKPTFPLMRRAKTHTSCCKTVYLCNLFSSFAVRFTYHWILRMYSYNKNVDHTVHMRRLLGVVMDRTSSTYFRKQLTGKNMRKYTFWCVRPVKTLITDQPVHECRLIRVFAVCYLDSQASKPSPEGSEDYDLTARMRKMIFVKTGLTR